MELTNAILQRRSIRGFRPDPIPQETLRQVLELASRAVSAQNTQPWEFAVVTGEPLEALRRANIEDLESGREPDYPDVPLEGVGLDRARVVGKQLYGAMGIERGDRERRHWWLQRGFRFFDAPAVILLYMDEHWDEMSHRFEMGTIAQNLCLAAMEFGLGTCVEYQAIMYQRGIREQLDLPAGKRFACGIAIGYPDDSFPANQVVTPREDVDAMTHWYGF